MNKPYEICRDIGYDDVIGICSQCKETREHVYCKRIVYDGDQEKWVCDECQSPSQIPLPSPVLRKPIESSKTSGTVKRLPLKSKVPYLPPEEAMVLESGAPKSKLSLSKTTLKKRSPPSFSVIPVSRAGPPAIRKPLKTGNMTRSSSDETRLAAEKKKSVTHRQHALKESSVDMGWSSRSAQTYNGTEEKVTGKGSGRHLCQGTSAMPRPSRELLNSSTEGKNNDVIRLIEDLRAARSERRSQCQSSDALTALPFSELQELIMEKHGDDVCANTQQKSTDAESMESSNVKLLLNHPVESPTWRGSFNVTSNVLSRGFYDGIVAHPPCKVHKKVYELSKQLPELLQFELLPRSSLWVELFDEDIPSAIDVGLYFLPSKSSEEMYSCLVECLNEYNMLLKSHINGVELLIFSSKNLEDGCEKIDQRYFLWGVFRSCEDTVMGDKVTSVGTAAPIDDQPFWMEEDMEVDMIGGQELGNVDKVVSKPAQPVLDATPEFSPVKVKEEIPSLGCGIGNSSTWDLSSLIEMCFERELQKSFDRFDAAYMKGKGIRQDVKLEKY